MRKQLSILFLGGAKRVSLAEYLIAEGEKRDLDVRIFSYELSREVPIACVGKVIWGKRWKDPELDEHLAATIREYHIGMVLPFVDPAIEVASRLGQAFPEVFIPCSPVELCRTMFDKLYSHEWFMQHGIPVPQRFTEVSEFAYPVILKPRTGSASKGIKVANSTEDLAGVASLEEYLVQEYIAENEEYTVDCYVGQKGEILTIVPRIRLEVVGGEVASSRTVRNEEMIDLSRQILSADSFRGPITIQFIRNKQTGKCHVMEINPRLGGGVIASIAARANIPGFLLDEWEGKPVAAIEDWKENTLMTRYFKEVIFYANNH